MRAGLIPSLEAGLTAEAGAHWRICIYRPQNDPIRFLARALIEARVVRPVDLGDAAEGTVVETTLRRSSLGDWWTRCGPEKLDPHENY